MNKLKDIRLKKDARIKELENKIATLQIQLHETRNYFEEKAKKETGRLAV